MSLSLSVASPPPAATAVAAVWFAADFEKMGHERTDIVPISTANAGRLLKLAHITRTDMHASGFSRCHAAVRLGGDAVSFGLVSLRQRLVRTNKTEVCLFIVYFLVFSFLGFVSQVWQLGEDDFERVCDLFRAALARFRQPIPLHALTKYSGTISELESKTEGQTHSGAYFVLFRVLH